jgi:hypothetical protein
MNLDVRRPFVDARFHVTSDTGVSSPMVDQRPFTQGWDYSRVESWSVGMTM